jgi:hypothetical protein
MVRVYAIADGDGRWHVLPGGMTRGRREDASVSMQRGGTSLDTWVLTDGPVDTFSMLPQRCGRRHRARRRPVSSRTGENLFWLGRYTERTEQQVRLARATLMLIDADSDASPPCCRRCRRWRCAGWRPGACPRSRSRRTCVRARLLAAGRRATQGACSVAYNLAALERASRRCASACRPNNGA